jgi:hypothetical protein
LGDGPRPKQSGLGAMIASTSAPTSSNHLGSVKRKKPAASDETAGHIVIAKLLDENGNRTVGLRFGRNDA